MLVIVAVAAGGSRLAGLVAAASSALWFDFFLTEPYQRFTVTDHTDIETTVLLLAVGVGVTELAQWGRRATERAAREQSYLAGIQDVAAAVAQGSSSGDLVDEVGRQLTSTLGLRACHFQYGVAGLGEPARLLPDGSIVRNSAVVDVDRDGLPVDRDIELLVESGGLLQGRFLMSAGAGRPPVAGAAPGGRHARRASRLSDPRPVRREAQRSGSRGVDGDATPDEQKQAPKRRHRRTVAAQTLSPDGRLRVEPKLGLRSRSLTPLLGTCEHHRRWR